MSVADDLKKWFQTLTAQEKAGFLSQISKEKELYDMLKAAGFTPDITKVSEVGVKTSPTDETALDATAQPQNPIIPNYLTVRRPSEFTVASGKEGLDALQSAAGHLLIAIFYIGDDNSRNDMIPRVYCDGVSILPADVALVLWHDFYVTQTTQGITIGVYDATAHRYSLVVTVKYPFKTSLQIGYYNSGVADRSGFVYYNYEKIA